MKCKSTILKEECKYSKNDLETIGEEFDGSHVTSEPRSDELPDVVGVIDNSYYREGEGVVVESSIMDEHITEQIKNGTLSLTCSLVCSVDGENILDVDGVFTTMFPDPCVGETVVVD